MLILNNGATAVYVSGSATNALNFDYMVALGQDIPDLAVSAVSLNGATVTDLAGNADGLSGAVANPPGTLSIESIAVFEHHHHPGRWRSRPILCGPVADVQQEYHQPHARQSQRRRANWFIHSGAGDDAMMASSGTNVLDRESDQTS